MSVAKAFGALSKRHAVCAAAFRAAVTSAFFVPSTAAMAGVRATGFQFAYYVRFLEHRKSLGSRRIFFSPCLKRNPLWQVPRTNDQQCSRCRAAFGLYTEKSALLIGINIGGLGRFGFI